MGTNITATRIRSGVVRFVWLLCAIAVLSSSAWAQGAQDGSITGRVTDESGAVLPGVTVTVTGPALQQPELVALTGADGDYRITPLPIGTYQVVYTLQGFQSVRRAEVRLTAGFNARLDISLAVGGLEESITVSSVSPVVDVTATAPVTTLTRETLELVPSGRLGWISALAQAPGVRTNFDVGGSAFGGVPSFRAFGKTSLAWRLLEGVSGNSPKVAQSGTFIDFASIEEIRVQTVGSTADVMGHGIAVNAIVKSGSNNFHGTSWWNQTNGNFQSNNITDELRAAGITEGGKVRNRLTLSTDIGGPIMHDKLWFYTGITYKKDDIEALNVFESPGNIAVMNSNEMWSINKVSYQMNQNNRFVYFLELDRQFGRTTPSTVSQFAPWTSTTNQTWTGPTTKGEWQGTSGNALVMNFQYGYRAWVSLFDPICCEIATRDLTTQQLTGTNWNSGWDNPHEKNFHARGSVSYYKQDTLGGNHQLTTGFDHLLGKISRVRHARGEAKDYQLIFNSGRPTQIATNNYPTIPQDFDSYLGFYVMDKWAVGRSLTLDLGLRYAYDRGYVKDYCQPAGTFSPGGCYEKQELPTYHQFAPRLNLAYDITGNGKTIVKGGWGRYNQQWQVDPDIDTLDFGIPYNITWRWSDPNGNRQLDPGEVNFDPNGPDFISVSGTSFTAAANFAIPNPDLKPTKTDEFFGSIEHELMSNMSVRFTAVHTTVNNNYYLQNNFIPYEAYTIPVTRPIPGPNNVVDPSLGLGTMTYYEYPTRLNGIQYLQGQLINAENNDQDFTSYEATATKRFTNGWQFLVSYARTQIDVPVSGDTPTSNPNSEIFAALDYWETTAKVSASYTLPWDVMLSGNYERRSGTPQARTAVFTGGTTIPTITLRVEEQGSVYLPSTNLFDMRLEKRFELGGQRNAAVRLNIYNLPNSSTVTAQNLASGNRYLLPTAIMPPRLFEVSASFAF